LARFGTQVKDIDGEFFRSPNYTHADYVVICSLMSEEDLGHLERVIKEALDDGKKVFVCKNIFTWMERATYTKLDRLIISGLLSGADTGALALEINRRYTQDFLGGEYMNVEQRIVVERQSEKLKLLKKEYGVTVLDRMDYVCGSGECEVVSENLGKYFFDKGHHTLLGAAYFGRRVDELGFSELLLGESAHLQ